MKSATIIKTEREIIIYPTSRTTQGLGIASEPYIHLNVDESSKKIADSIATAFASIKFNLPHPEQSQWKEITKQYLREVGFKSSKEMHNSFIKSCNVQEIDKKLCFTPTSNDVKAKFFDFLPSKEVYVSINETPDKIIAALNEAFERCE